MRTFLTIICITLTFWAGAIDRESFADGNWSSQCTWDLSCSQAIPGKSDDVTIYHDVILDVYLTGSSQIKGTLTITASGSLTDQSGGSAFDMRIQNQGSLIIEGDVVIEGDVEFQGDADLIIRNNSSFTINGSVSWSGNANIQIEGGSTMNVGGNLDILAGSDNILIDGVINVGGNLNIGAGALIDGSGSIDIIGSVTNDGTVFGESGSNVNCTDCSLPSTPLPVELTRFEAKVNVNGQVDILWETALEINNSHFEVQRSSDLGYWEVIEIIAGKGTYVGNTQYSFTDVYPTKGLSYYRLRQVDYDEKFEYSPISSVIIGAGADLFPAIVVQNGALALVGTSTESESFNVAVLNVMGQSLYQTNLDAQEGTSQGLAYEVPKGSILLIVVTKLSSGQRETTKIWVE